MKNDRASFIVDTLAALAVLTIIATACTPAPTPATPAAPSILPSATVLSPTATATATPAPPIETATATLVPPTATLSAQPTEEREMAEHYPMTAPSISAGAKVYAANCTTCHGQKGDGKGPSAAGLTPPASDFTDPELAYGDPPQDWYVSIVQGRPTTAMPSYQGKLSESDIWNVLFYARRFITTPQKIAAGKASYAQNCAACHGDNGDGNGPLGAALNPPAANFTDAPMMAAHASQELFDTLSNGMGAMPGFKSSLTDDQRWDVVNYLWTLVYAP